MNSLRIGGIASGFDTEQIIRDLMRIERMKMDKLYQNRQVLEWKKEQFREVINSVRSFRDKYFDVLRPETNMMSASSLKQMEALSSDKNILTAAASGDVLPGSREIEVFQLATASRGSSAGGVTSAIIGSEDITGQIEVTSGNNVIKVSLNGNIKEITVDEGTYDLNGIDGFTETLQEKIDAAFGVGRIVVSGEGNRLILDTVSNVDILSVFSDTYGNGGDILTQAKIQSGASNRLDLSGTMEAVSAKLEGGSLAFNENGKFNLTINDVTIEIDKTDTLRTVLGKINNSAAGVTLIYSSFNDSFTLESKNTGNGTIVFDDGGNFFNALKISSEDIAEGQEARFAIDGSEVASRSSNTFTVDGITYTVSAVGTATVTTSVDTEGVYEVIESFVDDYNSLITEINGKLSAELFRDFPPLTDEQKEDMSEKEIELWEEKAKSGMLRREPSLENMLREMRSALYDLVGDFHLTEIGIQTSNNYRDQGKLVLINGGNTLRAAIETNPDKVAEIFTRKSAIAYSPNLSSEERAQRYKESGLAHRLSDILNDNIRTTRDSSGRKGTLLERAGIEGDVTQFNNYYDRQINDVNKRIDRMNEMLFRKEEQYYRQFAAMEKALQQLYAQGDWLAMQMSQFQS